MRDDYDGPTLGIDLGGTSTKVVVRGRGTSILGFTETGTGPITDISQTLNRVQSLITETLSKANISLSEVVSAGFALPGEVDFENGIFISSPILPNWKKVDVRSRMLQATGLEFATDNDANAVLLAESTFGAARGAESVLLLTIGTGIGGALMAGGRIHRGNQFSAGEIGHISVESDGERCWCGGIGCLGLYASTSAALTYYNRAAGAENQCSSGKQFADRFFECDLIAIQTLDRMTEYLAKGISMGCCVIAPEKVVLFGGILGSMSKPLLSRIETRLQSRNYPTAISVAKLCAAELGSISGALGASLLSQIA